MTPIADLARAPRPAAAPATLLNGVITYALAIGVLALTIVAAQAGV
jgi:hypothetical protein